MEILVVNTEKILSRGRVERLGELSKVFDEAWEAAVSEEVEAGCLAAQESRMGEGKPRRRVKVRGRVFRHTVCF